MRRATSPSMATCCIAFSYCSKSHMIFTMCVYFSSQNLVRSISCLFATGNNSLCTIAIPSPSPIYAILMVSVNVRSLTRPPSIREGHFISMVQIQHQLHFVGNVLDVLHNLDLCCHLIACAHPAILPTENHIC